MKLKTVAKSTYKAKTSYDGSYYVGHARDLKSPF